MKHRLVRIIDAIKVRNMCMKYQFYTRGDCEAYDFLLRELCGYDDREVDVVDIEIIASDIVSHSAKKVFEENLEDPRFTACLFWVMSLVADECCRTEVR